MFAVVVTFTISPDHMARFMPLMRGNAKSSLKEELGCRQFDVCTDPDRPNEVFLYELYDDEAAFAIHLASEHYARFQAAVGDMIIDKQVRTYREVDL